MEEINDDLGEDSERWRVEKEILARSWNPYVEEFDNNLHGLARDGVKLFMTCCISQLSFCTRAYYSSRCRGDMMDGNVSKTLDL
uniref:Uncharacterized protein n=1 Tax=Manihot esculenta TaxID=3983 RepID=A0A2C9US14_MANES